MIYFILVRLHQCLYTARACALTPGQMQPSIGFRAKTSWQKRMARASCWPPAASRRRCSASRSPQVRQLKRATTLLRLNILRWCTERLLNVQVNDENSCPTSTALMLCLGYEALRGWLPDDIACAHMALKVNMGLVHMAFDAVRTAKWCNHRRQTLAF